MKFWEFIISAMAVVALLPTSCPAADAKQEPFADFGFLPDPDDLPARYKGQIFRLSQDYPAARPAPDDKAAKILRHDLDWIKANWKSYMMEVRDYCFEGNVENDWRVERNSVRKWYHIPWQHYGPNGREGLHGLTKEAPVQLKQLAATQTYTGGQTYAVAIYNDLAGYTIGQVWKDHSHPSLERMPEGGFPDGSVVCKPLLVDVPVEQVPSLDPPFQWDAYITDDFGTTQRNFHKVSLIQMDIMVKDSKIPSHWFLGTFQYNGKMGNRNRWNNLVPVGLMFGNDPNVAGDANTNPQPTATKINPELKESLINPDANELPPTHLGWNGRLNGPVDNPRSSCMSCHMTGEYPRVTQMSPLFYPPPTFAPGSKQWMRWFQTLDGTKAFDDGKSDDYKDCSGKLVQDKVRPTDFSLQLEISVDNFEDWMDSGAGKCAGSYHMKRLKAVRDLVRE